ncbi:hypothetical protein H5410_014884 [Solanum commersonii]|uniref:F-box/LRR-repeat protein 15/At3g58940/PEG3-like LRR domain-containing protein n=1 Tax=Solanum commersonii TaxID=4109 RepID=A0A9J5ZSR5_SOLCO|nr:hypothetical protein H5410_014884 [Solanum commersonii]
MMNMNNHGTKVIIDENEIDKISNLPMDILDKIFKDIEFFKEISGNIGLTKDGFSGLINNILFRHVGSIVDLGHWLLCITSKCVKELTLKNHKHNCYTLPFGIFDCPTLTYLDVTNFIVKPPSSKTLFPNLLELTLKSIKVHPTKANYVLNTPITYILNINCLQWCSFAHHICS